MEIGIDSFASTGELENPLDAKGNIRSMSDLLKRIEFADESGLDVFGKYINRLTNYSIGHP